MRNARFLRLFEANTEPKLAKKIFKTSKFKVKLVVIEDYTLALGTYSGKVERIVNKFLLRLAMRNI